MYEELRRRAGEPRDVGGLPVFVASLDDLIAMKEATDRPRDRVMASGLQELSDELQEAPGEGSSERPPPAVFTPLVTAAVPRTDRRAPGRPRRRDLGGLRSGRSPGDPSAAREGGHRAPPSARRLRRRPRPRSRWPSSEATRPSGPIGIRPPMLLPSIFSTRCRGLSPTASCRPRSRILRGRTPPPSLDQSSGTRSR